MTDQHPRPLTILESSARFQGALLRLAANILRGLPTTFFDAMAEELAEAARCADRNADQYRREFTDMMMDVEGCGDHERRT